jgi:hypothetical protein
MFAIAQLVTSGEANRALKTEKLRQLTGAFSMHD